MRPLDIGLAFDLRSDFEPPPGAPDDLLEEYDAPETIDAVERALASAGHRVRRLGGGRRLVTRLLEQPPELVFNLAEGRGSRSREAHVPAVCEMLGVPFTHSDPLTMALTLDKAMAKRVVGGAGGATPPFAVIDEPRDLDRLRLPFPVFAKPLCEGSSVGIRRRSRLADPAALARHVTALLEDYGQPVLVEEFCPGAELTVAVLGTGRSARVVATAEIEPLQVPAEEFVYGLEVKRSPTWADEIAHRVPPRRPPAVVQAAEALALLAYRALGCRDVARIDLRCDRDGHPMFIECNPLPGLAPGWSDLSLVWDRLGRSHAQLVLAIADEAASRWGL